MACREIEKPESAILVGFSNARSTTIRVKHQSYGSYHAAREINREKW